MGEYVQYQYVIPVVDRIKTCVIKLKVKGRLDTLSGEPQTETRHDYIATLMADM